MAKLEIHCSDYHVNSTFYPIVDLFERKILSIQKEDTTAEKMNKLEKWMDFMAHPDSMSQQERLPHIMNLNGLLLLFQNSYYLAQEGTLDI